MGYCGYFHLTWGISTLHGQFHLVLIFSPCMTTQPYVGYFYLAWCISILHGCHFQLTWGIFTSCGHFHLTWTFSSCMRDFHLAWPCHLTWGISTLHGTFSPCMTISTLHRAFSTCMGIVTLCGHFHLALGIFTLHSHFHLMWTFLPCVDISILHGVFSPCMGHRHLVWPFAPHVGHFCLGWPFPYCMDILTLCAHFHLTWPSFHLAYMQDGVPFTSPKSHLTWPSNLSYPLACTLTSHAPSMWKWYILPFMEKFPKNARSNPNSINKVPLRATNNGSEMKIEVNTKGGAIARFVGIFFY